MSPFIRDSAVKPATNGGEGADSGAPTRAGQPAPLQLSRRATSSRSNGSHAASSRTVRAQQLAPQQFAPQQFARRLFARRQFPNSSRSNGSRSNSSRSNSSRSNSSHANRSRSNTSHAANPADDDAEATPGPSRARPRRGRRLPSPTTALVAGCASPPLTWAARQHQREGPRLTGRAFPWSGRSGLAARRPRFAPARSPTITREPTGRGSRRRASSRTPRPF